jgi:hypothetical protein
MFAILASAIFKKKCMLIAYVIIYSLSRKHGSLST